MRKLLLSIVAIFSFAILSAQNSSAEVGDIYGESFEINSSTNILEPSKVYAGITMEGVFTGTVVEVCTKKGCWVKLELANGDKATIKMKEYDFFVPEEIAGKEIYINGKAELKTVSVDELKHIAEDGGKSQDEIDAITQPEETISIVADGIKVKG